MLFKSFRLRAAIITLVIALSVPALALTNPLKNIERALSAQDEKSPKDDKDRKRKEKEDEEKDKQEKDKDEDKKARKDKSDEEDEDEEDRDDDGEDEDEDEDDEEDEDKDEDESEDDDEDKDESEDEGEDEDEDKDEGDEEGGESEEAEADRPETRGGGEEREELAKAKPEAAPSVETVEVVAVKETAGEPIAAVAATVETEPVPNTGDAADDPAIWIHPKDPSQSTIIGTNKQGGLAVYDLTGKQLQYLPDGQMNNVDLRAGFKLGGKETALVVASNRSNNSIAVYRVNPDTRLLENVAARAITTKPLYGACMYRSPKSGKFYAFTTGKSGDVEQWELSDIGGKVDAIKVRGFKLGTQVEGCVADDELGHFYVGEEAVGIWKFNAEPDGGTTPTQVDKAGSGGHLVADVEGLTIAYGKDGRGYLIVSSQGNNSFVVYKREGNNAYLKTFKIAADNGMDGVEDTDGIDVTMVNLGPAFPQGVFVVQDGMNDKGNQNFKLVPCQLILGDL